MGLFFDAKEEIKTLDPKDGKPHLSRGYSRSHINELLGLMEDAGYEIIDIKITGDGTHWFYILYR